MEIQMVVVVYWMEIQRMGLMNVMEKQLVVQLQHLLNVQREMVIAQNLDVLNQLKPEPVVVSDVEYY